MAHGTELKDGAAQGRPLDVQILFYLNLLDE